MCLPIGLSVIALVQLRLASLPNVAQPMSPLSSSSSLMAFKPPTMLPSKDVNAHSTPWATDSFNPPLGRRMALREFRFWQQAVQYPVYLVRFHLDLPDPDRPTFLHHVTIFVETRPDRSGFIHHVTGDVTSMQGMSYERKPRDEPDKSRTYHSKEFLGVTDASTYPGAFDDVLKQIPPPHRQKAFNARTMRTEPFKTENPLTFYEPGEERRPLFKCTEWTLERAIPALRAAGVIKDVVAG
ncbi:predicted protein [Uncinocarpus reesii 1704]|uniref:Uncharacterized protein n=1 Tax=Uncinocarpus reesii (strain UAMH 1704) TaxID=336963 RepID=C4JSN8_UNCRE|nr:uncharacterized protein UREG_05477 [Uncinocarpus reesii 1704]EEP80635.1 predicted protein [Uncinocarpus reesii 1704]